MKLLTTGELADKLQVDVDTIRRFEKVEEGFPRAIRISKKTVRWDECEIDKWLETRKEINHEDD